MIDEGTRVFCHNISLVLKSIVTSLILLSSWFCSRSGHGSSARKELKELKRASSKRRSSKQGGRDWSWWELWWCWWRDDDGEGVVEDVEAVSKVVEIDGDENCDDVHDEMMMKTWWWCCWRCWRCCTRGRSNVNPHVWVADSLRHN